MPEIFSIPDLGEARLSLKEYDDMREEIRRLKEREQELTDMLDHVCEENKVRVRRQIIRSRELTANPRACGQQEIIDDRLVNMEDVTQELDKKIHECEEGWKRKCEEMETSNKSITKTLDECQRQKISLEQEVDRLKHRNWWERLWNK